MSTRILVKRALSDLIIRENQPVSVTASAPNNPPIWVTQPVPIFALGTSANYSFLALADDPDGDPVTVALNTSAAPLPTGVTFNNILGQLQYDGSGSSATATNDHIATLNDGTDTTDSDPFSVSVQDEQSESYPLTATPRGATRAVFQTDSTSVQNRNAIGVHDASQHIGLDSGTQMDTTPPASGYVSRAAAYQAILNSHPTGEHYVFTYHNVTEAFASAQATTARAIKIRDYLESLTGPNGTDGYAYNSSGNKVILFGEQFTINNSDFVQPEFYAPTSTNITYPEWYAREIAQLEHLDVMASAGLGVGAGGCNIFLDNHQHHSNRSGISWDAVGGNDNARDFYDSEEPNHLSADPVATSAYSECRTNMRIAVDTWDAANPGHVTLLNTNQWADKPNDRLDIPESFGELRNCIREYRLGSDPSQGYNRTGYSENNSSNRLSSFPRSGVGANGLNRGQSGNWLRSYFNGYQSRRLSQAPHIVFQSWSVECLQSANTGSGGVATYPVVPASNSVWNMFRWAACTAWLAGCHIAVSGIRVGSTSSGRAGSTPVFDEYGLINGSVNYIQGLGTGSTKLFRKWMGPALEVPPVAPKADGTWQREFQNALIVLNPDNDENDSPRTVDVSAFPGGSSEWMRFNGVQDPSTNDGSNADTDFALNPIDAIVLVRRPWYEAL